MGSMKRHMRERSTLEKNINMHPVLPESLNVELNNTCNQKCVFCNEHGPYNDCGLKPCVMDIEFAKKIIKEASRLGIGRKELGFYLYGEVFLYKDFPEVVRFSKENGFPYTFITTNGVFATPDRLQEVIEAGLDSIRFSVNAADKVTYKWAHGTDDFEVVVRNIKYLHEYIAKNKVDIATSISCVVTKKTFKDIEKMRELFSPLVDEILFVPVSNLDILKSNDEEMSLDELLYQDQAPAKKEKICPLVFNSMYIEASGEIGVCCNPIGAKVKAGKITPDNINLEEIWYGEVMEKYRKAFINNNVTGLPCEKCFIHTGHGDIADWDKLFGEKINEFS